jgi:hypothetical protein
MTETINKATGKKLGVLPDGKFDSPRCAWGDVLNPGSDQSPEERNRRIDPSMGVPAILHVPAGVDVNELFAQQVYAQGQAGSEIPEGASLEDVIEFVNQVEYAFPHRQP